MKKGLIVLPVILLAILVSCSVGTPGTAESNDSSDNTASFFGYTVMKTLPESPEVVKEGLENAMHSTAIVTKAPSSVDLSGYMPPIGNQGSIGSC
jgi:hypothetical protein